jgi:hypothetical protein
MPNNDDEFDTPLDAPVMPAAPRRVPQAQPTAQPPQRMPAVMQKPEPAPIVNKYAPYVMPTRIGIADNESQTSFFEASDMNEVVLATLCDILNRLERIERSI